MAGDWMKIELELPDKPEVHYIANALNLDPDAVVGKLIRIWQWFDKHTTDGNAFGVTYSLLDRITSVTGFGESMFLCGWMEQNDKVLTMPKFDRHTSESAKTRALTSKRVNKSRANNVTQMYENCNAENVTKTLPEKRREEKNINTLARIEKKPSIHAVDFNFVKGEFENLNGHMDIWKKAYPAVSIENELNSIAAWLMANPANRKSNYARFINNWLKKNQDRAPRKDSSDPLNLGKYI